VTSDDGEMTKTKVADTEKLYNFIGNDIFIWIHLESRTLILNSIEHNTRIKNI
jgi:hypothetical protein